MHLSIRGKMMLAIAVPTAVIYLAVFLLVIAYLRNQTHAAVKKRVVETAEINADRFDDYIEKAARVADMTARFMESAPHLTEPEIYATLRAVVSQNRRVYGAAVAFEPGISRDDRHLFCPYVFKGARGIEEMNIGEEILDWYNEAQWWQQAKAIGNGVWTDPYFDKGAGNALMTTYSAPFFSNGVFRGVTTVDMDLPGLRKDIGEGLLTSGGFYVLSKKGLIVYSPNAGDIGRRTIHDIVAASGNSELEPIVGQLLAGTSGVATVKGLFGPREKVVAFAPVPSTEWVFITYEPARYVFAGIWKHLTVVTVLILGALALIVLSILWMSGRLVRPLVQLTDNVGRMADGDLHARIDAPGGDDEIGQLAHTFNRLTDDLQTHIRRLAREQADREQAESANQAKSDFLSHMSHELRTPLNGMLGYAQILQRDRETTPHHQEALASIVRCGNHLLSLINDVLDLSKIEAGQLDVDDAPCDVRRLVREVGDVVAQRAAAKRLTCEADVSPDSPRGILTDPAKLRQILINLLGNAVKFTEAGQVTLRVSKQPEKTMRFVVEDTGVGMSEDDLRVVFDPFKQVAAGKAAGGTGLGLAISTRLAEALGGRLHVESVLGKGSSFTLTLPLREAPPEGLEGPGDVLDDEARQSIQRHLDAKPVVSVGDLREETSTATGDAAALPDVMAARLRKGLEIRNLTALTAVAHDLSAKTETEHLGRRVQDLVRSFDFKGLTQLLGETEARNAEHEPTNE